MIDRFRPYLPTALFAALSFYFGAHALTGERGLLVGARREEMLSESSRELAALQKERRELEARAAYLSDANLSRDLLEERSRAVLGFVGPRDYVIRTPAAP